MATTSGAVASLLWFGPGLDVLRLERRAYVPIPRVLCTGPSASSWPQEARLIVILPSLNASFSSGAACEAQIFHFADVSDRSTGNGGHPLSYIDAISFRQT